MTTYLISANGIIAACVLVIVIGHMRNYYFRKKTKAICGNYEIRIKERNKTIYDIRKLVDKLQAALELSSKALSMKRFEIMEGKSKKEGNECRQCREIQSILHAFSMAGELDKPYRYWKSKDVCAKLDYYAYKANAKERNNMQKLWTLVTTDSELNPIKDIGAVIQPPDTHPQINLCGYLFRSRDEAEEIMNTVYANADRIAVCAVDELEDN